MYIIALEGHNQRGKSTTLRRLIQILTDDPRGSFVCKKDKDRFDKTNGDIKLPLLYDHHLLAITTTGDAPSFVKPCFEQYGEFVEIIVCATHKEGTAIYRYLESFSKQNHIVKFIQKTVAEDSKREELCNQQDAERLQKELDDILNKRMDINKED